MALESGANWNASFMEGEESENLAKTQRGGARIINEGSENQTCTFVRDKRRL